MRWSLRLGQIAGIGIYVHATFTLIILWVALIHWSQGSTMAQGLEGVGLTLSIFACVLLHELGHSLAALRFGIKTKDITLLPIGGLARLERMPEKPIQELWVALAGPAVNVVIAALLALGLTLTGGARPLSEITPVEGPFLERLMMVNLFLVGFNMLPAFPMDGGRVLRALLATRLDYALATRAAASIGQGMALLFGFAGLLSNPFLIVIAFFVWIGAAQEAGMATMKSALRGVPVSAAMLTEFHTLTPFDPLARAVELVIAGSQHDFPVLEEGVPAGVLLRGDLISGLARSGRETPVAEVMRREFEMVDARDMLEDALPRLQAGPVPLALVMRGGRLAGMLTGENMGEFLMIRTALGADRSGSRAGG